MSLRSARYHIYKFLSSTKQQVFEPVIRLPRGPLRSSPIIPLTRVEMPHGRPPRQHFRYQTTGDQEPAPLTEETTQTQVHEDIEMPLRKQKHRITNLIYQPQESGPPSTQNGNSKPIIKSYVRTRQPLTRPLFTVKNEGKRTIKPAGNSQPLHTPAILLPCRG